MKNLFVSGLLAIAVVTSSFSPDPKINYAVRSSFESQFSTAENVEWTAGKNFTKATFVLRNVRTEAFYNDNGELIGTSYGITLEELPVNAKRAFAKKYGDYTVKEAIRFDGIQEGAYYISAVNEKGAVILKVEDAGFISALK